MLPVDLFRRPIFALSAATAVCRFVAQNLAFVLPGGCRIAIAWLARRGRAGLSMRGPRVARAAARSSVRLRHRSANGALPRWHRLVPVPNIRAQMATGVVATSRAIGQATGAALVALCLGSVGRHAATLAA